MASKEDILNSITKSEKTSGSTIPKKLTILPLRDVVIFPHMIFPVLIGRQNSLKSIAEAMERDKFIYVAAQKDPSIEDPELKDIYAYGTVAKIIQVLRLPNNLLKVLVEGVVQARITGQVRSAAVRDGLLEAKVEVIHPDMNHQPTEIEAMVRHASDLFSDYIRTNRNTPPELSSALENIDDPLRKLYFIAANVQQKVENKQKILQATDLADQYYQLISLLTSELELLKIEEEIDTKVHDTIQKTQKKYFIQEQIRALQKELGEDEDVIPELASLREAIEKAQMPPHALAKAMEEFDKLKKTPSMSPEFGVQRNYIETLAALPWSTRTGDNLNIDHVKAILDEDHYDLDRPKERILEFISVLNLVGSLRGQILCFVGPPGVGKTSLARSIARALGRKFVRISLGGVHDEAEIRGHRRTYIGAMPGKIIHSMKRAASINPVILLDEVDKMASDFRGDPASALLEVLDPEQNNAFNDHFLEVDYDLSNVLFITTANVKYDIPLPLLDRMEVIELSSYLDPDKVQITRRHILPKLIKENGLDDLKITVSDEAIFKIVRGYTREAGVRNLERELANVLRKVAKSVVQELSAVTPAASGNGSKKPEEPLLNGFVRTTAAFKKLAKKRTFTIDAEQVEKYLKAPRFKDKPNQLEDKVGVATGLAWTSSGGDVLPVEVTIMPGTEKLTLTGKLGDVMKESATAALSYVRSSWAELGVPEDFYKQREIHIHVPEGAIPKDGPSAGITMTMALISAAASRPLRGNVAMTGEITLRGNVLPIGGLNEKLLAAKRQGITVVIVPRENEKDVAELSDAIKEGLSITSVSTVMEAIPFVFR